MIFPKLKTPNRKRGSRHPLPNGVRCLNRLCQDAYLAGRRNMRKASAYGPRQKSRWLCTTCGKTFSQTRFEKVHYRVRKTKEASFVQTLASSGLSLRHLARIAGTARTSVARWVKLKTKI